MSFRLARMGNTFNAELAEKIRTVSGTVYNADYYGVVGDGISDDTLPMQLALDAVEAEGGGYIFLPAGTIALTNVLNVGANTKLIGAGRNASILQQLHETEDCLVIDSGADYTPAHVGIESLGIEMLATGTPGDGINFVGLGRAGQSHARDIFITGGASNWAITNNGNNQVNLTSIHCAVSGNGCRWLNASGAINYGDAFILGLEVTLSSADTTGVLLNGSAATVNNLAFVRTEVKAIGSVTGCIGIDLESQAKRNSFTLTDIENCGLTTGASISITDGSCELNTFVQTNHIGSGTVISDSSNEGDNDFIGGTLEFRALESHTRKLTDTADYTDTDSPVSLTVADSEVVNRSTGSAGRVVFLVPTATTAGSRVYRFYNDTAGQDIRVTLSSPDQLILWSLDQTTAQMDNIITSPTTQGAYLEIRSTENNRWEVVTMRGLWTLQTPAAVS